MSISWDSLGGAPWSSFSGPENGWKTVVVSGTDSLGLRLGGLLQLQCNASSLDSLVVVLAPTDSPVCNMLTSGDTLGLLLGEVRDISLSVEASDDLSCGLEFSSEMVKDDWPSLPLVETVWVEEAELAAPGRWGKTNGGGAVWTKQS